MYTKNMPQQTNLHAQNINLPEFNVVNNFRQHISRNVHDVIKSTEHIHTSIRVKNYTKSMHQSGD